MHIQSLELRLQSQSRSLETRHWDVEALKEEVTRLQGALEMSQSLVDNAQEQAGRYVQQMEEAQKSERCKCIRSANQR